jgi:hypothetical protein
MNAIPQSGRYTNVNYAIDFSFDCLDDENRSRSSFVLTILVPDRIPIKLLL